MITEDYVPFEIAKLLKEKGFDEVCKTAYETITKKHEVEPCCSSDWGKLNQIKRPTLQMAMKWLREVYGLFIRITEDITGNVFEWSVYQKYYGCRVSTYVEDSYEKASETAIKYCLENLIYE